MPAKLSTTISKIATIPNRTNSDLVKGFCQYMIDNDASERHQNNNLKSVISFAIYLGPHIIIVMSCILILILIWPNP